MLVALLSGLKRTGGERGIGTLCVGGEGMALAVEMVARAGDHPRGEQVGWLDPDR